jgi:hypothetical protein
VEGHVAEVLEKAGIEAGASQDLRFAQRALLDRRQLEGGLG